MALVRPPKRVYRTFPKIGREALFLPTGEGNPRNGEGAFIRLADGAILFAYTAYEGDDYHDNCRASISGILTRDEGETWSAPRTLLPCPPDAENLMSVSLLRMKNGEIGIFFIRKELLNGTVIYRYQTARSADEGKTWSEPADCIGDRNVYVVNNDRVIRLKNGDILFPASLHDYRAEPGKLAPGAVHFFRSSDDGRSFEETPAALVSPVEGDRDGFQEPGVFELPDGRIRAWTRTRLGCQYAAISADGGRTFGEPAPDFRFTSPLSPMLVKTVGKYTLAVFNPVPEHAANPKPFGMDRTPLMLSVSEDGGLSFPRSYLLEDDPDCAYCYPAITECAGGFLVAYYHSNHTEQFLNALKIAKVTFDEIKEGAPCR